MTDNTDPQTTSGFNRRTFIAGAVGTAGKTSSCDEEPGAIISGLAQEA